MKKRNSSSTLGMTETEFRRILVPVTDNERLKYYGVPFSRKTLYKGSCRGVYPFIVHIGGILCVDINKFYDWVDATNNKETEIKNKFSMIMGGK